MKAGIITHVWLRNSDCWTYLKHREARVKVLAVNDDGSLVVTRVNLFGVPYGPETVTVRRNGDSYEEPLPVEAIA